MCQLMSGIITKNSTIYDLDFDSHEKLIKKAGLKDTTNNPDFVRVEIIPVDGNVFNHDPKNWQLKVDQDFRPEWFSEKFAESEMRKALADLFASRFLINDRSGRKIENQRFFLKNSSVEAWENSSVVARGNSSVEAWENSSVEAWGNSSVEAWGNSSVVAWENSSVEARGNSSVVIPYSKEVKVKGVHDNGSVKDVTDAKRPVIYVASRSIKLKIFKK